MKTHNVVLVCGAMAISCQAGSNSDSGMSSGIASGGSATESATDGTGGSGEGENGPGNGPSGPEDSSGGDSNTDGAPKYDVGQGGANFCKDKEAGSYCFDNTSIVCGDMGNEVSNEACTGNFCLEGDGCVECLAGQFDCKGAGVYQCNDAADPPVWEQIATCDPAANQGCDLALGTCVPLTLLGGTTPTGQYYQFAYFANGDVFRGGYDVDGIDDTLYVASSAGGVDVYTVALLDSDGDGQFEPNQHPDNPDDTGPIEERVLTFVENIAYPGTLSLSVAELYVAADRLFVGGPQITEYIFASGALSTITAAPPWTQGGYGQFSHIGYDDVNDVWYASNESQRRVFQYCAETDTWGLSFLYPDLAGSHMDGMEVVTDPETGIPYVYVSDMTSDFIGQYLKDPDLGWTQLNLFSYAGTVGEAVEGMGFGPLNHFWATGGLGVYELGGGDLAEFTEPPG